MYNRTKKIPTIIALLLLLIGIGGGIYLIENRTGESSVAKTLQEPSSIRVTNLNDTFFTITWLTREPSTGSVVYSASTKDISRIAFDDRDEDNKPKPYLTHHVTVRNLEPQTAYFFKVVSGGKTYQDKNSPYSIKTAPKVAETNSLEPAYGQILNSQNQPAEGALVILNLPNALPLSTLTKPSGNWLIPLNIARDIDLKPYNPTGVVVETIFVYTSPQEQAQATTDINNDSPVPPITIGKTYNFEGLQGKKKEEELAQGEIDEESILGKQTGKKIDILTPEEGAKFVSSRPLFRGKGVPGKEVIIEIESSEKISGKTTVSKDGIWSWTPPYDLSPDKHKVKITTTDELGNKIVIERNFLVFKSGTQVLGEATPSATLTPTLTPSADVDQASPSPTLEPLFSPTPESATSTIPISGNISYTVYLIGAGLLLISLGFAKLFLPL